MIYVSVSIKTTIIIRLLRFRSESTAILTLTWCIGARDSKWRGDGGRASPGAGGRWRCFIPARHRRQMHRTNMSAAEVVFQIEEVRRSSVVIICEAIVTCRNVAGRALSGLSPSGARGTAAFAPAAAGTASFAGAGGGAAAGMDPPAPLTRMLFSMRAASAPLPRAFRPANQRVDVSESDTSAQFHTRSG
jgi:hypothetical protein